MGRVFGLGQELRGATDRDRLDLGVRRASQIFKVFSSKAAAGQENSSPEPDRIQAGK
jgi:hypothetical protein